MQAQLELPRVSSQTSTAIPPSYWGLHSSYQSQQQTRTAPTPTYSSYRPQYVSSQASLPAPPPPRVESEDMRRAREYLSQIPREFHFWTSDAQVNHSTATQTSSLLESQTVHQSAWLREDLETNVIAFDINSRSQTLLRTIEELRNHLRRQRSAVSRPYVYLVDTETLSPEVVGLLGYSLNLSVAFWKAHWAQRRGLGSSQMRPTAVVNNRGISLAYATTTTSTGNEGRVSSLRPTVSVGFVAESSSPHWSSGKYLITAAELYRDP